MARSGIMFQYFEWYMGDLENNLWIRLKEDAVHLKDLGITSVWIPPAFKATSPFDTGYGAYDLYDLGEFDQKGSVKTKYGSKEELLEAIRVLHEHGIHVYADVILNHKANGDEKEIFMAREVDPFNRTKAISELYEIEAWTKFTFPGRGDRYSAFKWNWNHFSGTDFNARDMKHAVFMIDGINKGWSQGVTYENGNFDYLMFNDIDYKHPDVVEEIRNWALWFVNETGVDGFRFDAVKHINDFFIRDLIRKIRGEYRTDFYAVGEYWNQVNGVINDYLDKTDFEMDLFDVKLHFNMHSAGNFGDRYDMSKIFEGTLVREHPDYAVTFVDSHDSQPTQALQSWVEAWFKPLAYALILLRRDGYPMVFYGDYYGIKAAESIEGQQAIIDKLLYLRNLHAYGKQVDYFDHNNIVGWVRMGDEVHPYGCAVVMSNGEGGEKQMNVGSINQGAVYADYTGNRTDKVAIDKHGNGLFPCNGGQVSVWVRDQVTAGDAFNEDKIDGSV
ncbi:MAG: alpha-amylase [Clostridia bacterium]